MSKTETFLNPEVGPLPVRNACAIAARVGRALHTSEDELVHRRIQDVLRIHHATSKVELVRNNARHVKKAC